MADTYSFDEDGARRVVRAVRISEGNTFTRHPASRTGADFSAVPHVVAIRVVGDQLVNGLWPGKYEQLATSSTTPSYTSSTTSTTSTTTSTTPAPTTTTYGPTARPSCDRWDDSYKTSAGTFDCYLALNQGDAGGIIIGQTVVVAMFNGVSSDGIPIYLHSDLKCATTTTKTPCTGKQTWGWDSTNKKWQHSSDTCSAGCVGAYPTFCPTSDCAQTVTSCVLPAAVGNPPNCTGTTSTTTTTTTTLAPGCVGKSCTFAGDNAGGWTQVSNPCLPSCPCNKPTSASTFCATTGMPCQAPTTTTIAPCNGICNFSWNSGSSQWLPDPKNICTGASTCACPYPSYPGSACGDRSSTACVDPRTTPPPTTTTHKPGDCTGKCIYQADGAGGWHYVSTDCLMCSCSPPMGTSATCEFKITTCGTTTTTTTTSTTTVPPCSGRCTYKCVSTTWTLIDCGCTGTGCGCNSALLGSLSCSAGFGGADSYTSTLCSTGSACTTSTTTTSTTPVPCPNGCSYQCQSPHVTCTSGSQMTLIGNFCTFSCGCPPCPDPVGKPYEVNATVVVNCATGTTTTTTSTTTTTTTLAPGFYCWRCSGGSCTCSMTNPGGCVAASGPYASSLACSGSCPPMSC